MIVGGSSFDCSTISPFSRSLSSLTQIIHAISNLESSYLTIQGPPGAGKSYTGKHVIAELMKSGARVGIASNSHKAINNRQNPRLWCQPHWTVEYD
jgi:Cdc6-like AAA superfamily ATPase